MELIISKILAVLMVFFCLYIYAIIHSIKGNDTLFSLVNIAINMVILAKINFFFDGFKNNKHVNKQNKIYKVSPRPDR